MYRIFSILLTLAAFGFGLAACEQDPNSSEPAGNFMDQPNAAPSKTTPDAHPAFLLSSNDYFVYKGQYVTRYRLAVCDTDQTDRTVVYTCASQYDNLNSATWSASGASASFVEMVNGVTKTYKIRALDVSVPTSGKTAGIPQVSNLRTLVSTSDKITFQAWGRSASADLIAYMTQSSSEYAVYTISVSGGGPTKIYSIATSSGSLSGLSWSPDGSQLAIGEQNGSDWAIKLINTSGTVNTTLASGLYQRIALIKWSRAGSNQLAYSAVPAGITPGYAGQLGHNLYLISAASGSTPTLLKEGYTAYDEQRGYNPSLWSPDNSELVYHRYAVKYSFSGTSVSSVAATSSWRLVLGTGAESQLDFNPNAGLADWKVPS